MLSRKKFNKIVATAIVTTCLVTLPNTVGAATVNGANKSESKVEQEVSTSKESESEKDNSENKEKSDTKKTEEQKQDSDKEGDLSNNDTESKKTEKPQKEDEKEVTEESNKQDSSNDEAKKDNKEEKTESKDKKDTESKDKEKNNKDKDNKDNKKEEAVNNTEEETNIDKEKAKENAKDDSQVNKEVNVKQESERKKITFMMYMDADNNLESALLRDVEEIKEGYNDNADINVVVLIDRVGSYSNDSTTLGENFTDTRMFEISHNKATRIDGGDKFKEITKTSNYEANMGDARTLKKFIKSCKNNYPAEKYVLVMSNHGGGAKDKDELKNLNKAICWDDSDDNDCLYTAEISDVLSQNESVDMLVFDACLMGTAEVAYQFRPGNGSFETKYIGASSPVVWGYGLPYDSIFERLSSEPIESNELDITLGGTEKSFNPGDITLKQLGGIIVEEQRDSVYDFGITNQQYSLYDLRKVNSVKIAVDKLAQKLSEKNERKFLEKIRGTGRNSNIISYFDKNNEVEWVLYPYFDLYDMCKKINANKSFSDETKALAKDVMRVTDSMIVYSFGQDDFAAFRESKNGLSILLPDGAKVYSDPTSGFQIQHWVVQRWYNPNDTEEKGLNTPYGKLSWCKDGINKEINKVGNWFELLDSWYDKSNDENGGSNAFQW